MANARAIDVAAYLAVQDCRKYGIPTTVIAPPYTAGRAGITDHNYVTRVLKDGNHTDVGPNFPWPYFAERVAYWVNPKPAPAPPPPKPPAPPAPVPPASGLPGDRVERLTVEWAAFLGDLDAIAAVAQAARTDTRAQRVLAAIERTNPGALREFITRG